MAGLTREQARAQAEEHIIEAEHHAGALHAVLSFLDLTSGEHIHMCTAKSEKPRDWGTWFKGINQGPDIGPRKRQSSASGGKKKEKPGKAEEGEVRAAYREWKRQLRVKRLETMLWQTQDIEQRLHSIWQSYCDKHAATTSGAQYVTITGFLRLLFDCHLLDNLATPSQVDDLVAGAIYKQGRKEAKLDFAAFRNSLARVAAFRAAVKRARHQVVTASKPAPDIQSADFIQPFLSITLPPVKLPEPVRISHSSNGLTTPLTRPSKPSFSIAGPRDSDNDVSPHPIRSLGRTISKVRYSESYPVADESSRPVKEYNPDAPPQPRPLMRRLSSLKPHGSLKDRADGFMSPVDPGAGAVMDAHERPWGAQTSCLVQSPTPPPFNKAVTDDQHGSKTPGQHITLQKWHTFIRNWVLPLAKPTGVSQSSPLNGLFARKSLDVLQLVEPSLRHLFGLYAKLTNQQAESRPWLKVVAGHSTLDVRHLAEMMHNFKISPCFLSRAAISEIYKACPPQDTRSGWFDGGLNFSRFLITLALIAIKVVETLPYRIQVNATPEDLKCIRQLVTGYVPCATRERLEAQLQHVEVARRRTLDDQGRTMASMPFFEYQGLRLNAQMQQEEDHHNASHLLHVLDRREEMRQKLALRRLHNYYADVRTCQSAPMPGAGSISTSTVPALPPLTEQASDFTTLEVSSSGRVGSKARAKPRGSLKGNPSADMQVNHLGMRDVAFFDSSIQIKTPKLLPHSMWASVHPSASPRAQQGAPALPGGSSRGRADSSPCTSWQHPGLGRHSALSSETLNHHLSHLARGGHHRCDTMQMLTIEARDESEVIRGFTRTLPCLTLQQSCAASEAQRTTACKQLTDDSSQAEHRGMSAGETSAVGLSAQGVRTDADHQVASTPSSASQPGDSSNFVLAQESFGLTEQGEGTSLSDHQQAGTMSAVELGFVPTASDSQVAIPSALSSFRAQSSCDTSHSAGLSTSFVGSRPKAPSSLPVLKRARPQASAVIAEIMRAGPPPSLQYNQARAIGLMQA